MKDEGLITVAFAKPVDQRLMADRLTSLGYQLVEFPKRCVPSSDLFILDVPSARRLGREVIELKKRAEVFLPALIAVGSREPAGPWLAAGFDDILRLPVPKAVLEARVASLVRLRQQARLLAEKGAERYQAIFEATGTATVVVGEDTTILMANQECLRIIGYSPEELIGTKMTSYVAPESLETVLKHHKARLEDPEGAPLRCEARLVDGAGRVHTVSLSAGLLPGTRQSILSLIDVTERREAEERLRESEERNRIIADLISDYAYVFRVTPQGELQGEWVTESFTKVFGLTREEIDARGGWQSLVHPDDLPLALRHAQKVAGGEPDTCEMRWVTRSGEVRWLRDYAQPIFDSSGRQTIRVCGAAQDITEHKRAETVLRESEERFVKVFQKVPLALAVSAVEDGRLLEVNDCCIARLGLPREEIIGKTPLELGMISPEDHSRIAQMMRDQHRIEDLEVTTRSKDDRECTALMSVTPLVISAKPRLLISALDVTERKQAEQALRASEAQLSNALRLAHLGHWEYDVSSGLFTFSDHFYALLRTTAEREGGYTMPPARYAERFVHPDDRLLVLAERQKALEATDPHYSVQFEHKTIYADGEVGHMAVRVFILKNDQGRTVKTFGVNQDITERKKAEEQLQVALVGLKRAVGTTIQVMGSAVEARDPYTSGHQSRVARLARMIAVELGFPQDKIDAIWMAASVHDIGKLAVPGELLSKPTKLNDIELALINEHTFKGFEILKQVESPWPLAEIVYQHHERLDGSGHPRHLKGREILAEARVVAVCDVVEAMVSHRPYRPALGIDAAMEEIERNRGILYDADVVDACLGLFRERSWSWSRPPE